jgi:hypothetical protein
MGVDFTCKSWGKGSTAHSYHVAQGMFKGELRSFVSTTRKQAKDMFKKMVRKYSAKQVDAYTNENNTNTQN